MRDKKESKKLYYVDSVKPINHGEKFIVRLLDQTPYSYMAKKVYAEILPGLVDKRLFLYNREKKKDKFRVITEGRQNGFHDGVFIRLNEKSQKYKQKKLLQLQLEYENIEVYPDEEVDKQPELQKQKYKKKEQFWDFNFGLTGTIKEIPPKLYCFNVGQGDMSLFISSRGHAFIIDTHITDSRKQDILAELKRILGGRPIEALILTHRHYDHYLGAYKLYYLTGDMGYETLEEEDLKDFHEQVVLKVSHHGSDTGTSCSFLYRLHRNVINLLYRINNQCIPDYCPIATKNKAVNCQAFISVGKNNRYGHPDKKCLNQLKYAGFNTILSHSKKEVHCF